MDGSACSFPVFLLLLLFLGFFLPLFRGIRSDCDAAAAAAASAAVLKPH